MSYIPTKTPHRFQQLFPSLEQAFSVIEYKLHATHTDTTKSTNHTCFTALIRGYNIYVGTHGTEVHNYYVYVVARSRQACHIHCAQIWMDARSIPIIRVITD